MEAVLVALIVGLLGVLGQWLLKRQDYARQDEISAKAAAVVGGKLDVIHTLVDGNMTAAMQSEYDAIGRELAMMQEVVRLHEAAGRAPTPEALTAITTTRTKRDELQAKLHDRVTTEAQIRNS